MCRLSETHLAAPRKYTMGFEHDARTILSKVLAEGMQHKLNFHVGFEPGFILLEQSLEVYVPVISSGTLAMHGLHNNFLPLLEESVMAIHNAGIYTCKFRAEFGPARFEVAIAPMEAIDGLIYSQEAIRSIASKHVVYAIFRPKPEMTSPYIFQWNPSTRNSSLTNSSPGFSSTCDRCVCS